MGPVAYGPLAAEDLEPFEEPILEAVRLGDLATVDAALDADRAAITARSHVYSLDALGLAFSMGSLKLASHLLDRGADPNSWDENDSTPLSAALGLPDPLRGEAIGLLAARGVELRRCDLYAAVETGALRIVELCRALPRRAEDESAVEGDPPQDEAVFAGLLAAAARRNDVEAMNAVFEAAPQLELTPVLLVRAFESAAERGSLEAWDRLSRCPLPDPLRVVAGLVRGHRAGHRQAIERMTDELLARLPAAAELLLAHAAGLPELEAQALRHGAKPGVSPAPIPSPPPAPDLRQSRRNSDAFLVLHGIGWGLGLIFLIVLALALLEWLGWVR